MKKHHPKNQRKLPKLNPLPKQIEKLRQYFAPTETYARFYGEYATSLGKIRRFSFQVALDPDTRGWEKYSIISHICNTILQNKIPLHEPGQVFSFHELYHHTQWVRVRSILQYKVGMAYG
jgi:hypothetical protein